MKVQWWLAELDQYGNPKLIDGAHGDREGPEKAACLIRRLNLSGDTTKRLAVARVELFDTEKSSEADRSTSSTTEILREEWDGK